MNAEAIAQRLNAKPIGDGYIGPCPAHQDDRASLSIGTGMDDRVLLHCHAGCSTDAVIAAAGLTYADLQPSISVAVSTSSLRTIASIYPYTDEVGSLLYEVLRYEPKDFRQRRPDGAGWKWSLNGTRRVLYRLPVVPGKKAAGTNAAR